jgi:hypothetical protein
VTEQLRPFLAEATAECADVLEALGGVDRVSPQQRILAEDLARLGVAIRGTLAAYLKSEDPDLASRLGTLTGARRASLVVLGLERLEHEVPSLEAYLRAKARENRSDEAIEPGSDTLPADAASSASRGNQGSESGRCPSGGSRPLSSTPIQSPRGERHEENDHSTGLPRTEEVPPR